MTPLSATSMLDAQAHRAGAATSSVIADLMQRSLRLAETQDLDLAANRPADGEPDPGKDRRRAPPRGAQLPAWSVKKLERFIADNLERSLHLETLAPVVRLSCSHFARACKNTLGFTPRQLVLRRRLEHALTLMRDLSTPLSQVALACGFADQAHFSRLFREAVGTPPSQWRRENLRPSVN